MSRHTAHRSNKINGRICRDEISSSLHTNELIQIHDGSLSFTTFIPLVAVLWEKVRRQSWNLLSNKTNQTVKSAADSYHNEIKFNNKLFHILLLYFYFEAQCETDFRTF